MSRRTLAILFTLTFATITLAPSVLAVVDSSYDISLLINSTEEEEKKVQDFENPSRETVEYGFVVNRIAKSLSFHKENYNSLFKEHFSPPPEV
ncbi:MAG: hypothetical protein R2785_06780 [Flavobacteriaceae bacterium]